MGVTGHPSDITRVRDKVAGVIDELLGLSGPPVPAADAAVVHLRAALATLNGAVVQLGAG